jgi:hypothetical protein
LFGSGECSNLLLVALEMSFHSVTITCSVHKLQFPALSSRLHLSVFRQVLFGSGECSNLLLVALETQVWAWDLLTMVLAWWQDTAVTVMLPQPKSTNIALFTRKYHVDVINHCQPGVMLNQYSMVD